MENQPEIETTETTTPKIPHVLVVDGHYNHVWTVVEPVMNRLAPENAPFLNRISKTIKAITVEKGIEPNMGTLIGKYCPQKYLENPIGDILMFTIYAILEA